MINVKWGIAALALEIGSWASVDFLSNRSDAALLSYLALHATASALLALSVYPLLGGARSQPRWAVLSLIACFSFVVPIVGFIAVVLAVIAIRVSDTRTHSDSYATVTLPEFDLHQNLNAAGRATGMRSLLNNRAAPKQNRFTALVSLNHVSGHVASPMLRDVLNDQNDDLRLLAYGMLDRMEQKISNAIHEETQIWKHELQQSQEHDTVVSERGLTAAHRLSDLYWELIYQGLASDDMRDFAIQESLRYCELVLDHKLDDGPLTLRRGRLLHAQGRLQEAQICYLLALQQDLPETQVIPYQAQLHFERHEYAQVKELMRSLKPHNTLPKLRPLIDYWS